MNNISDISDDLEDIEKETKKSILSALNKLEWRATPREIQMKLEDNGIAELKENTIIVYAKTMKVLEYNNYEQLVVVNDIEQAKSMI